PGGSLTYLPGEYQLAKSDAGSIHWPGAYLPGVFADSSIAMDLRFVGPVPAQAWFRIGCRFSANHGYFGDIHPALRTAALTRIDGDFDQPTTLVTETPESALGRTVPVHVEFTCSGITMTLALNGTVVLATQDGTYRSGRDT